MALRLPGLLRHLRPAHSNTDAIPVTHPDPYAYGGPTNTAGASPTIAPGAHKQGDLNCTGSVDGADAVVALRFKLGLSLPGRPAGCPAIGGGSPKFGDVNCDGKVDLKDALAIVQFWSGAAIDPAQPGGCTALGANLPAWNAVAAAGFTFGVPFLREVPAGRNVGT